MDTGKNNKYYAGYEDSTKLIISYSNGNKSMEIWEGYFADMLDQPNLSGTGWTGFTRDYHQCEGLWEDDTDCYELNTEEYLHDLEQYANGTFDYPETTEMITDLIKFLSAAQIAGIKVVASIEEF